MTEALKNWLKNEKEKGTLVVCRATKDGEWKWFCRLVGKTKAAISYNDDLDAAMCNALHEVT